MAPKRKESPPTQLIDVQTLKPGQYLSSHNYYIVVGSDGTHLHVKDMDGVEIAISNDLVDSECLSSHQYTTQSKVTRTELSHIIQNIGHAVFRVTFCKQPTAATISEGLEKEDVSTPAKRIKVIHKLLEGETRVMHGRLYRTPENDGDFGRIKVIDLEASKPGMPAHRLVDTRTISELIVEGVRYYV